MNPKLMQQSRLSIKLSLTVSTDLMPKLLKQPEILQVLVMMAMVAVEEVQ